MNILEFLIYWTVEKIQVQKRVNIWGDEVQKWRRIEDPHENVSI